VRDGARYHLAIAVCDVCDSQRLVGRVKKLLYSRDLLAVVGTLQLQKARAHFSLESVPLRPLKEIEHLLYTHGQLYSDVKPGTNLRIT
jgi:predicted DCC family thiol-disulfide oxidoreductase YuxK